MVPPSSGTGGFFWCDLVVLFLLALLLLFSLFSVGAILRFHHRRLPRCHLLQDFNSLWTVRLLLVLSALLCCLCELLRLPRLRHLPILHHVGLCKIYIVASQGLFQPAFFITLLFLLNASLRKPANEENTLLRALSLLLFSCLPLFLLQTVFVFYSERLLLSLGDQGVLFDFFRRHAVVAVADGSSRHGVLCTYPLFSTILLTGFGALYVFCFLIVCWRTVELVINRSLRVRVYALAAAVVSALPAQASCLFLSMLWDPHDRPFEMLSLAAFCCLLLCGLFGEGILVIRPIVDALAAGG